MASKFPMQEQEVLSLKPQGLWTFPNQLSAVPQGALKKAQNVVIDKPSIIDQRRGFAPYGIELPDTINKIYNFQNTLIINHGSTLAYDSDSLGTWTDYTGTFLPPPSALSIHSVHANKNIYFTTASGMYKLDQLAGPILPSGAPTGLDGKATVTITAGWFTNLTQVAYRIIFGYNDANGNLILGAPSQRIIASNNSGGPKTVDITFSLPDGLTTAWFYQIYRSPMSADLNTEPNDELQLVYTGNPTAGELVSKVVTVTDISDDSLKGATIYTASSQQGINQANIQPPIAADIAYFRGFTLAANIIQKEQFFLTMTVVGSPNGVQVNDTIIIDGITYTGKGAENIAANEFKVDTSGTPSQNIVSTANSLIRVINRSASNSTIYAYYESGYSDLPGKILLTTRMIGTTGFTVQATGHPAAYIPDLTTAQDSSNEIGLNKVAISKYLQPEAFPTLQTIPAGAADKSILRIIPLRDYVLIFKQDGVFQLVGNDLSSFQITEVDNTLLIRGLETAVSLNNKVYAFSNQTIVSVTYNEGSVLKSLPIKRDLLHLASPLFPNFDSISFGVNYESDNKYIIGTVSIDTDSAASQYYVYNYLTDSWTQWILPFKMQTGFINPTDDKLYLGSGDPSSLFVYKERKNFDSSDYADDSYPLNITSASGMIVNVDTVSGARVGYTLYQAGKVAIITQILGPNQIEVNKSVIWSADPATYFIPISVSIEFVPESCGNPGIVKHFKEVHSLFATADFDEFNLGFATDFSTSKVTVPLIPKITTGWGLGNWGNFPWGSGGLDLQNIRGLVPLNQRKGHWVNLSVDYAEALTNFSLSGFAIFYGSMSQKFH